MPEISYPSIPDPNIDPNAMLNTLARLKETVELMTGQTKDQRFSFPNQMRTVERRSATSSARFTEELQIQANSLEAVAVRTTDLESGLNDAFAAVNTEQAARISQDGILASDITNVTVKANGATATGQVYLKSEIAPGGYSAQYGWYLTATGLPEIGMKALLSTDGTASIAFTASRFKLTDPAHLSGTPIEVFNYNGATFNFGVPVTVLNQEIGANAVSNTVAASGNVASGTTLVTPSLTVRAGARVLVEVKLSDTSGSIYLASSSASFIARSFDVSADATIIGQLISMDTVVTSQFLGGSSYTFYKAYTPSSILFVVTGLSAGAHTFNVGNPYAPTLGMSITATELSK